MDDDSDYQPSEDEADEQVAREDNVVVTVLENEDDEDGGLCPIAKVVRKRRRFTVQEKLSFVQRIRSKIVGGDSMRKACSDFNLHHKQYLLWRAQFQKMIHTGNNKARSLCTGRLSILHSYEKELLRFIFELREQGMGVSSTTLMIRAAYLCKQFRNKSRNAQYFVVQRFIKRHRLVYRMATHESQRDPREVEVEAKDFIANIRDKLNQTCRHQDFILNMDQMPIPFSYNRKKTLEVVGQRTIHVRKSTSDTKRATFAMTVTASGKVLQPVLVFKGKPKGRIVQKELTNFPKDILYQCQENAWMDESVMLFWVENVLRPYVEKAPENIVPILFLDSYRCHMMASVVEAIQDMGVEVEHIPGGCTSLCQPVDIGVNRPFKTRIRDQWELWMIHEGVVHGTTSPPTRLDITNWAIIAKNGLCEEMVKNAWRHGEYAFFLGTRS